MIPFPLLHLGLITDLGPQNGSFVEVLLETRRREMEPRFSLVLRDNPLAEGGGNMSKVVRKLQLPLQEIRTRMDCELPWVKLKVEGCRKSGDGGKQKEQGEAFI